MIGLTFKLEEEIISAAYRHEKLRNRCKEYLGRYGKNYDKFTVVEHDSFIGYVTETAVKRFILENYSDKGITVTSWEDCFDLARLHSILDSDSADTDDIGYVQGYFYDRYDLCIESPKDRIFIDVKTALTKKEPTSGWDFMYPVVQARKEGKDYMILTYYTVNDIQKVTELKKIVLAGYTSEEIIKTCNIIKKGEKTRFWTLSLTDNYETKLSEHYMDINGLMQLL